MNINNKQLTYIVILAGMGSLITFMGVGRFTYTALVEPMISNGLSKNSSGIIASANYLGYLIGSLLTLFMKGSRIRYIGFTTALITSILTTALMGATNSEQAWIFIRLISGISSGVGFVFCSAMVFDILKSINSIQYATLLYSGVGIGIVISGSLTPAVYMHSNISYAWFAIAIVCVPLAIFAIKTFSIQNKIGTQKTSDQQPSASNKREYIKVITVYFLEGLGYIIYATYIIALVKQETASAFAANIAWVICGLTGMFSVPIIRNVVTRIGIKRAIFSAFIVQSIGVLLPAISTNLTIIAISGVMFGMTFMSLSILCMQHGSEVSGRTTAVTFGTMTTIYSIGQIIGPIIASILADKTDSFNISFILSATVLFIAGMLYLTDIKTSQNHG